VSPQFEAQRQKYEDAESLEQKIAELEKLLSLAPGHKGAEKMVSDYRKKLARHKADLEKKKEIERARRGGGSDEGVIKKEGAGQVCLMGVTGSGKSTLINSVTNADFTIGDHPFTTAVPVPAMMTLEDVNIQLVELPGVFEGSRDTGIGRQAMALARNTDCIAIVVDLSQDIDSQMNVILTEIDRSRIRLNKEKSAVRVERVGMGGQMVYGAQNYQGDIEEVREYLRASKVANIIVRFQKPATFQQFVDAFDASVVYVRALVIATKGDIIGSSERYEELKAKFGDRFDIIPVSAAKEQNLDAMKRTLFDHLDILRVYTKSPGRDPDEKPIILPEGAVVEDAARKVHKQLFVERFRAAVIFRENDKIKRRQVGLSYPLQDRDVLQLLHT
jgi:ribosome-interacting GTPase 1